MKELTALTIFAKKLHHRYLTRSYNLIKTATLVYLDIFVRVQPQGVA